MRHVTPIVRPIAPQRDGGIEDEAVDTRPIDHARQRVDGGSVGWIPLEIYGAVQNGAGDDRRVVESDEGRENVLGYGHDRAGRK